MRSFLASRSVEGLVADSLVTLHVGFDRVKRVEHRLPAFPQLHLYRHSKMNPGSIPHEVGLRLTLSDARILPNHHPVRRHSRHVDETMVFRGIPIRAQSAGIRP
jgi:hypothetical protein